MSISNVQAQSAPFYGKDDPSLPRNVNPAPPNTNQGSTGGTRPQNIGATPASQDKSIVSSLADNVLDTASHIPVLGDLMRKVGYQPSESDQGSLLGNAEEITKKAREIALGAILDRFNEIRKNPLILTGPGYAIDLANKMRADLNDKESVAPVLKALGELPIAGIGPNVVRAELALANGKTEEAKEAAIDALLEAAGMVPLPAGKGAKFISNGLRKEAGALAKGEVREEVIRNMPKETAGVTTNSGKPLVKPLQHVNGKYGYLAGPTSSKLKEVSDHFATNRGVKLERKGNFLNSDDLLKSPEFFRAERGGNGHEYNAGYLKGKISQALHLAQNDKSEMADMKRVVLAEALSRGGATAAGGEVVMPTLKDAERILESMRGLNLADAIAGKGAPIGEDAWRTIMTLKNSATGSDVLKTLTADSAKLPAGLVTSDEAKLRAKMPDMFLKAAHDLRVVNHELSADPAKLVTQWETGRKGVAPEKQGDFDRLFSALKGAHAVLQEKPGKLPKLDDNTLWNMSMVDNKLTIKDEKKIIDGLNRLDKWLDNGTGKESLRDKPGKLLLNNTDKNPLGALGTTDRQQIAAKVSDFIKGLKDGEEVTLHDGGVVGVTSKGVNDAFVKATGAYAGPQVDLTKGRQAIFSLKNTGSELQLFVGVEDAKKGSVGVVAQGSQSVDLEKYIGIGPTLEFASEEGSVTGGLGSTTRKGVVIRHPAADGKAISDDDKRKFAEVVHDMLAKSEDGKSRLQHIVNEGNVEIGEAPEITVNTLKSKKYEVTAEGGGSLGVGPNAQFTNAELGAGVSGGVKIEGAQQFTETRERGNNTVHTLSSQFKTGGKGSAEGSANAVLKAPVDVGESADIKGGQWTWKKSAEKEGKLPVGNTSLNEASIHEINGRFTSYDREKTFDNFDEFKARIEAELKAGTDQTRRGKLGEFLKQAKEMQKLESPSFVIDFQMKPKQLELLNAYRDILKTASNEENKEVARKFLGKINELYDNPSSWQVSSARVMEETSEATSSNTERYMLGVTASDRSQGIKKLENKLEFRP